MGQLGCPAWALLCKLIAWPLTPDDLVDAGNVDIRAALRMCLRRRLYTLTVGSWDLFLPLCLWVMCVVILIPARSVLAGGYTACSLHHPLPLWRCFSNNLGVPNNSPQVKFEILGTVFDVLHVQIKIVQRQRIACFVVQHSVQRQPVGYRCRRLAGAL